MIAINLMGSNAKITDINKKKIVTENNKQTDTTQTIEIELYQIQVYASYM